MSEMTKEEVEEMIRKHELQMESKMNEQELKFRMVIREHQFRTELERAKFNLEKSVYATVDEYPDECRLLARVIDLIEDIQQYSSHRHNDDEDIPEYTELMEAMSKTIDDAPGNRE